MPTITHSFNQSFRSLSSYVCKIFLKKSIFEKIPVFYPDKSNFIHPSMDFFKILDFLPTLIQSHVRTSWENFSADKKSDASNQPFQRFSRSYARMRRKRKRKSSVALQSSAKWSRTKSECNGKQFMSKICVRYQTKAVEVKKLIMPYSGSNASVARNTRTKITTWQKSIGWIARLEPSLWVTGVHLRRP